MAKNKVDVSVVAANYNNGRYLKDFIYSIVNSTVLPSELIIVNDGSTDNSLEILDEFSGLEILKVIKFEENRGLCEALNAGIELASAKYILRADPDDILFKHRIEKQFTFLEENKEIDVVGSNVMYFHDNTNKDISVSNFPEDHNNILKAYRKGEHGIQQPTVMVRTHVMKKFRYIQENFKSEDYDIFARVIHAGHKFANIKEPLNRMRVHTNSVSINIKYDTIKHTFALRDQIFNTQTNPLRMRLYYGYILNYKKYLIAKNPLRKYLYLGMAALFYPGKVLKRIFN